MSQTDKPLVNRVANSGLITIKPEDYYPEEAFANFDLKNFLFKGLILREKEFRAAVAEHDWNQYEGKVLCVYSSADAIIPVWAYMLVAVHAEPFAKMVFQGTEDEYIKHHMLDAIAQISPGDYTDQRIVIKGCSDKPVPPAIYLELSRKLQPVVKSIMYGEPCSTVPIYKKKKEAVN
ncbi:MAG: DUF2480 family protein [Bacteroidetes bacterium]|nr:DUF2480 family protein [Bacteroidota bacterium]